MVERRGAVLGVELWRGTLLHNECTMAIFFGWGCNNHPIEFQRKRFEFAFCIFHLNIFEYALWRDFGGVGGFKNEYNSMESNHNSFTPRQST